MPKEIVDPGAAPAAAAPAPPAAPTLAPNGKITMLVADDNENFRTGLCRALGFEDRLEVVAMAQDGQEAVLQAARHNPAVVLLDANMPRLSGIDAARQLRESQPQIAVLMMSVQSDEALVKEARESGVRHFLMKPFDPQDVSQLIDELFPV